MLGTPNNTFRISFMGDDDDDDDGRVAVEV